MSCGVPQGSVFGPLLLNNGNDWVLRGDLLPGVNLSYHVYDTLVSAHGSSYREAAMLITVVVS